MKSLYKLPEDVALKKFKYPNEWWYCGFVHEHHVSIFRYIWYLFLSLLFFGGGMQVLILPGYFRHVETQDNLFTKIFTFDNVYSDILFALRWSSVIVVGGLCILMLLVFLRDRQEVYTVRAYVTICVIIYFLYFLILALLFTLAFSPHPFPIFDDYYAVLLLGIFLQGLLSIRRYKKKLYDANELRDTTRWMILFPLLLSLYPVYLILKVVLAVGISGEEIGGAIWFVLALLYPYFLLLKPDVIVHWVLYMYLREYYIAKYPEGFRRQAGLSREEFYLGRSKERELIERLAREKAEKNREKRRWWRRLQIVQGIFAVLFLIFGIAMDPSTNLNFRLFAALLFCYGVLVLGEYLLWCLGGWIISLYKNRKEGEGDVPRR